MATKQRADSFALDNMIRFVAQRADEVERAADEVDRSVDADDTDRAAKWADRGKKAYKSALSRIMLVNGDVPDATAVDLLRCLRALQRMARQVGATTEELVTIDARIREWGGMLAGAAPVVGHPVVRAEKRANRIGMVGGLVIVAVGIILFILAALGVLR